MPTERLVLGGYGDVIHNCQQLRTTLCPPTRKQVGNCGTATPREYHSAIKRGEPVINTRPRLNPNHYVKLKGGRRKRIDKQFYLWRPRTGKTDPWSWMLVVTWGWGSREFGKRWLLEPMLYVLIWMIVTQLSNSIELSIWDMYFIVFEALAQLEAGLSSWR